LFFLRGSTEREKGASNLKKRTAHFFVGEKQRSWQDGKEKGVYLN